MCQYHILVGNHHHLYIVFLLLNIVFFIFRMFHYARNGVEWPKNCVFEPSLLMTSPMTSRVYVVPLIPKNGY